MPVSKEKPLKPQGHGYLIDAGIRAEFRVSVGRARRGGSKKKGQKGRRVKCGRTWRRKNEERNVELRGKDGVRGEERRK